MLEERATESRAQERTEDLTSPLMSEWGVGAPLLNVFFLEKYLIALSDTPLLDVGGRAGLESSFT